MKQLTKAIVLMALAVSCAKEIGRESTFDASTRRYNLSFAESTKTELSGTGSTRQVKWNSGDAIKYYTEPGQASPASTTVALEGSNAYVTIPRGRTDEFINAVYGASQLNSGSSTESVMYVTSPVKNEQSYTRFSEAHICAAFSNDLENPNLQFHNAASILKFTSASSVHKVVFSGNDGEIITAGSKGDLKITFSGGTLTTTAASTGGSSVTIATNGAESDFYIAIIPVSFTSGITVNYYDADNELIATKKTGGVVNTISASGAPKVVNLGNLQDWLNEATPIAIDLGLSVKWASFNVGASTPEGYGSYFSWGETEPKTEYKWASYKYGTSKNGPFSKYVIDPIYGTIDHKTILDPEDDAAHSTWGGDWRMPSKEEVEELKNSSNCTWTWTTKNGVPGYRITSNKSGYSGNSIFLPANGMFTGSSVSDDGTVGNYWSSSICPDVTYFALSPFFSSDYVKNGNCYRYFGLGVRPVFGSIVPVESISIPETLSLIFRKTESAVLIATILPENATYKGLTWVSSDTSVATVDASGKVMAVSPGIATITVYSADASKTATCMVTVSEPATINGTELVEGNDLVGLISDKSTGKGIPGVIVSDGYDCVATDANGVYQFKSNSLTRIIYYSTPAEYQVATSNPSVPNFYKAIKPDGEVIRTDFELNPLSGGKETNWTFIGIGDPQCATSSHASRYANETIPDIKKTLSGRSSVYAMTLGDIVFDSTNMWGTMKATMSAVSTGSWYIPFFQCIGNHDHDSLQPDTNDDAMDDYTATSTFVGVFGPTDYSFNRGDVHVVVMDDIIVSKQSSSSRSNGKTWNYSSGFTSKQFEWLKKDLSLVPDKENKMVFICCHIPFRGSSSNYYMDVAKQLLNFKEAHIMIGHTHYTQNYVYSMSSYTTKGGFYLYEHIHGSACGAWWTSSSSSTVTGEPNGYTIYDIEGAHIKDWHFKGTNKAADFQLRVYDGNEIYYQSKSYPLNWYTASQKAGSSSITVKGNVNLRYCFVAQVFNDDDTYWTVEMRKKSTGEKIGSFKRLANKSCTNVAVSAYYFNVKGKNSDSYSSVTASHYWYYLPASHDPANESDWEVVATQKIPGGEVTHTYTCSELTVESNLEKTLYF